MTTKYSKTEIREALGHLREILKPGDTVYTKLIHVSRSGMYRVIDLLIIKNNEPIWLSHYAAKLLEGYDERHKGCKAGGCGMDMGFHLVYNLGRVLWPDGFPVPVNYWRNRSYAEGEIETDSGYALHQRWM